MTERELLAAEMALRVLEGHELLEAQNLLQSDPAFAAEVADWEARLAPLFDEIGSVRPDAAMWERIRAAIGSDPANVISLKRKLRLWQIGGLAAAAAASLSLFLITTHREPVAPPAIDASAPILVASLASETEPASMETEPASMAVTYLPRTRALIVTPGRLRPREQRATELWVIPAGEAPISLGLVRTDSVERKTLPADLAAKLITGSTIAVSDEPAGGSPTGQPTGDVLAAGALSVG